MTWVSRWSHWHTLIFEGEVRLDMRYVCPNDVRKMLLQQARSVFWKKWAAKHEYDELKEGIWLAAEEDEGRMDGKTSKRCEIFFEGGCGNDSSTSVGKKSTTSLSLFMEAFGLEVEEELSTMATQTWAEGTWIGKKGTLSQKKLGSTRSQR